MRGLDDVSVFTQTLIKIIIKKFTWCDIQQIKYKFKLHANPYYLYFVSFYKDWSELLFYLVNKYCSCFDYLTMAYFKLIIWEFSSCPYKKNVATYFNPITKRPNKEILIILIVISNEYSK